MKDKILVLKDGIQLYIIDELNYLNRKFIYGIECDNKTSEVKNNHYVMEAKIINNKLIVEKIEDFEVSSVVNNLFVKRFLENI